MTPVEVEERNSELETSERPVARKNRGGPKTLPLLLEVGCEEIPARFLRDAETGLGERVLACLRDARLLGEVTALTDSTPVGENLEVAPGRQPSLAVQTYSTPRRLVVYVPALLAKQPDKVEEILGPPVQVAVDAKGNYTRAAESFAQKNSAHIENLSRTTTPKGEYLSLRKTTQGRSARETLPGILPGAILGLAFPKSMYWTEKSAPRFVRPIRWVLALLGEGKGATTVEFEILGVKSGNFTFGHRVHSRGRLVVKSFHEFGAKLRRAYVEFDRENRRQTIRNEANVLLEDSFRLVDDPELEEWIVNSTEWPSAIKGGFDERYLHLPREILTTVMRDHQKYFAVEDLHGKLEPRFVALLNVDADEMGLIRHGHERVLRARFADAEFFWDTDLKLPLERRMDILERVTYQAELGSYADKVRRMRAIAPEIWKVLEPERKFRPVDIDWTERAINLCKCDLTTQMVQEFPELQGIVGGLYAEAQGLGKEVSEAVYDHYLPQSAEGHCPRTLIGAVVSLADKLDSVVAGFAVGHEPSSSGDPYGLRRLGNGIIKVLLEFQLPIDLSGLVQSYHEKIEQGGWFGIQNSVPWAKVLVDVPQFLNERLRFYLESVRGLRYDNVRAVIAAAPKLAGVPMIAPLNLLQRAEALEGLRGSEDLEALCTAAKRIRNILTKSASAADWTPGEIAAELLTEPQEKELYDTYGRVAAESERAGQERDYRYALETISTLRPTVDRFFDKVLVMAEERATRQNRLRLLKKLDELFSGIAQFAEIAEKQ